MTLPDGLFSVVLTLVAISAFEACLTPGLSRGLWALLVVSGAEGGVGGPGRVLAGVHVVLGEKGRVGPQFVPLEGQERLRRLGEQSEGGGEVGGGWIDR